MNGETVTVEDTDDLLKINAAYRLGKNLLDRYSDIDLIEVERVIEEEP